MFTTDHLLPLLEEQLRKAVDEMSGNVDSMIVQASQQHLNTGGKRLRARLALAALSAFGKSPQEYMAWGTACELLHNATLVHDDLQDGDRLRRGHPTVWVRHGMAQAINTGDFLWMLPFLELGRFSIPDGIRWSLAELLARQSIEVIRGQSLEQALTVSQNVEKDQYYASIRGKTSALFAVPVEGAALIAGIPEIARRQLRTIFGDVGVMFQIQDDILDLYGDKGRDFTGADIREGKISALVVEHCVQCPEDKAKLLDVLGRERDSIDVSEVTWWINRFRERGSLGKLCESLLKMKESVLRKVDESPDLRGIMDITSTLIDLSLTPIGSVLEEL
ncbi:MAG: polyprenyl synthetase family protein [Myxococcota bacterium]|nr:polyprenyl synthetase family protein [Myxococcota bacterium]